MPSMWVACRAWANDTFLQWWNLFTLLCFVRVATSSTICQAVSRGIGEEAPCSSEQVEWSSGGISCIAGIGSERCWVLTLLIVLIVRSCELLQDCQRLLDLDPPSMSSSCHETGKRFASSWLKFRFPMHCFSGRNIRIILVRPESSIFTGDCSHTWRLWLQKAVQICSHQV
jgi:hypothetical protein